MARPQYPSDKQEQFMVRLPDGMRDRLKRRATANKRSTNAEIVSLLEEALNQSEAAEAWQLEYESHFAADENGNLSDEVEIENETQERTRAEARVANLAARKAFAEATAEILSRIDAMDRKIDSLVGNDKQRGGHVSPQT